MKRLRAYRFGTFRLDVLNQTLANGSEERDISGQRFILLLYLIENRPHQVTKGKLIECVWPGVRTDKRENLSELWGRVRELFGEANREYVRVRRRHYQFVANVEEEHEDVPEPARRAVATGAARQQKVLYTKIVHLRKKGFGEPVYRRELPNGQKIEVYDEIQFYSLSSFEEEQSYFEWSIFSHGDPPVTCITHPWQPTPWYVEPQLAVSPVPHINPRCSQPSKLYLTVTTMCNSIQAEEEVYAKVEVDAEYLRMVVDFASLPDPKPVFRESPTAWLETPDAGKSGKYHREPVELEQPYHWVFTAAAHNLRCGQRLKVMWSIDWSYALSRS